MLILDIPRERDKLPIQCRFQAILPKPTQSAFWMVFNPKYQLKHAQVCLLCPMAAYDHLMRKSGTIAVYYLQQ